MSPTSHASQSRHRDALRAQAEEITARVRTLTAGMNDAQLRWTPPDGGWSVGQVLEHLCIADDMYLERMRALVARPDAPRAAPDAEWRPTLAGRFLVRALERPRKLPAPRMWTPLAPRPGVAAAYAARLDELLALLDRGAALDWRRVRTSSPVSRLIRLNLGDCFTLLAVHGRRHLGQMERVAARPGFPA